jgi:methylmalonyl-CoA carboxyltransferase 12S subunit
MTETIPAEIQTTLEEILSQMTSLTERVARLEGQTATAVERASAVDGRDQAPATAPPKAISPVAAEAGISEEELVAISAAVAAYMGVRAHIRQIRVIHSNGAWAQQGRVSVQASHRLLY